MTKELQRDVKNCRVRWRSKLANFLCKADLYRLFRRKTKVIVVEIVPLCSGQGEMFAEDRFSSLVIEGGRLRSGLEHICGSDPRIALGSVNHESRIFAGLSGLRSQIGNDPNGGHGPSIVEGQFDRQSLEIVVQRYPVSYESP